MKASGLFVKGPDREDAGASELPGEYGADAGAQDAAAVDQAETPKLTGRPGNAVMPT